MWLKIPKILYSSIKMIPMKQSEQFFLRLKAKSAPSQNFSVFDHFKGNGAKLYKEVANLCREKGVYDIELWCPFEGAKEFWKKMGFYEKRDTHFYSRISKH